MAYSDSNSRLCPSPHTTHFSPLCTAILVIVVSTRAHSRSRPPAAGRPTARASAARVHRAPASMTSSLGFRTAHHSPDPHRERMPRISASAPRRRTRLRAGAAVTPPTLVHIWVSVFVCRCQRTTLHDADAAPTNVPRLHLRARPSSSSPRTRPRNRTDAGGGGAAVQAVAMIGWGIIISQAGGVDGRSAADWYQEQVSRRRARQSERAAVGADEAL
ncbi:hypothetical protein K438DRAFT_1866869 [Mycena galopus ATCC 62051]|nr:hypothetical protein K438DRAFT_1866869 [Mycena galopus ATCC 62051]